MGTHCRPSAIRQDSNLGPQDWEERDCDADIGAMPRATMSKQKLDRARALNRTPFGNELILVHFDRYPDTKGYRACS